MKKLLKDCLYIFFIVFVLFFITDRPSFSNSLKFAQLSDIHFSTVREDTSYKLLSKTKPLLEDAISQINNVKDVDFVMITGDGIDQADENSINGLLEELKDIDAPWYYVIGNHDTNPKTDFNKSRLMEILKSENKNFKFNSTYYTFKLKKNFRIIVLDCARNDKRGSNGFIPQEELTWLDDILKKSQKDIVLIFTHFPVVEPFEAKNHEIKNKEELKAVLKKYKMPIAIFSGHYHTTKITKRGNILHISTPALSGYPHAFRIVDVKNTRKNVTFKLDFYETGLKDLQAKTKIMTLGGARYYGRPTDRNTVIVIDKNK